MVRCRASFGQREEVMLKRIVGLALGLALGPPAPATDTISSTHVFPASLIYSRSFLEFVKKANEAGKGEFTIQVRGGPEAIGMMEQPGAVRSGVVDMVYSPCAFYAAVVPECDAVSASTVDGPTARRNGGIDLLNQIHQKRMGVVLLGWVDSGIRFTLWSTKEPKFDGSGHIDIKGFKVRGNPIYNAFLTNYLGAQVININSSELYTALERGIKTLAQWPEASRRFVAGARAASLARMKERTEKAGGMENYDRIVQLFTPG